MLARYEAVLCLQIEQSGLSVVDRPALAKLRAGLADPVGFGPWPPLSNDASLETLVLARMLAFTSFGADVEGADATELRTEIARRWPDLGRQREARIAGQPTPDYERIEIEVVLRADASVEWGYTRHAGETEPLPVRGPASNGRTEIDSYVQAFLRVALMDAVTAGT